MTSTPTPTSMPTMVDSALQLNESRHMTLGEFVGLIVAIILVFIVLLGVTYWRRKTLTTERIRPFQHNARKDSSKKRQGLFLAAYKYPPIDVEFDKENSETEIKIENQTWKQRLLSLISILVQCLLQCWTRPGRKQPTSELVDVTQIVISDPTTKPSNKNDKISKQNDSEKSEDLLKIIGNEGLAESDDLGAIEYPSREYRRRKSIEKLSSLPTTADNSLDSQGFGSDDIITELSTYATAQYERMIASSRLLRSITINNNQNEVTSNSEETSATRNV